MWVTDMAVVLIILIILALWLFLILPGHRNIPAVFKRDYAHRGLHDNKTIPENSLAAFGLAADNGYAIELVKGRVPILVELKGESLNQSLCPKTDAILSAYKGDYIVESFNPLLLAWYKKHRPEVIRGQLYTNVVKSKGFSPLNLLLTGMLFDFLVRPDFVAYDKVRPNSLPVALTRLFGAGQYVWTIKTPEEYAKKGKAFAIFEGFEP